MEAMLQSIADPVLAVDASLNVVFANPPAQELFSISESKENRRHAIEVIRDHECVALLERAVALGEALSGTLRLGPASGNDRIFYVAVSPILGGNHGVSGAVCVMHDQTQLRRLERVRSDFVANVSHEMRTPLTAIHGFIETLRDGSYRNPDRVKRYLDIMHAETTRLIAILNDLLALSRLEGPSGTLAREIVNLAAIACEVGELVRGQAEEKGIRLVVEADEDPKTQVDAGRLGASQPPESVQDEEAYVVLGDGPSIRRALLNLVDNAVKYTEAGGLVTVRVVPEGEGVRVTVVDTGVGIPPKDLDRVFERFYRVDKARSRKEGGTGLGLSIVKHTIERHGGRLGIDSTVGKGTTVWFWLPSGRKARSRGSTA